MWIRVQINIVQYTRVQNKVNKIFQNQRAWPLWEDEIRISWWTLLWLLSVQCSLNQCSVQLDSTMLLRAQNGIILPAYVIIVIRIKLKASRQPKTCCTGPKQTSYILLDTGFIGKFYKMRMSYLAIVWNKSKLSDHIQCKATAFEILREPEELWTF